MKEQFNFDAFNTQPRQSFNNHCISYPDQVLEVDRQFDNRNFNSMNFRDELNSMKVNSSDISQNRQNNSINFMNQNSVNSMDLAQPYEGFLQGNLFNNQYEPYKSYRPMRLIPNNEQAELLLNVNQYSFASHELRLYLDVYPNDQRMIQLFNQYRSMANNAVREYESKYGPLSWDSLSNPNGFSWVQDTWPWEMGVM